MKDVARSELNKIRAIIVKVLQRLESSPVREDWVQLYLASGRLETTMTRYERRARIKDLENELNELRKLDETFGCL